MTMKALTDEQRKFAEENHDLIYAFLKENSLPVVQYYDVVVFGYLCAVQEYCENPKLQTFAFATLAWKRMRREVFNYRKYLSKDVGSHATTMYLQDIQYDRISENLVCKQDELMVQLETELILHALAKKLPSKELPKPSALPSMTSSSCWPEHMIRSCRFYWVKKKQGGQCKNEKVYFPEWALTISFERGTVRAYTTRRRHYPYLKGCGNFGSHRCICSV